MTETYIYKRQVKYHMSESYDSHNESELCLSLERPCLCKHLSNSTGFQLKIILITLLDLFCIYITFLYYKSIIQILLGYVLLTGCNIAQFSAYMCVSW